jgi:REP element-mobilizing transposase RayT
MARPIRLEFSGALYHVTARGDRRESIYEDDADREEFLSLLGDVVGLFNWRCHAWCLMTNHYHLVVETPDANLSKGMRQLNGVFTQWSNRRHPDRNDAMRAAWATGEYSYAQIAEHFGVHFTTVGRIIRSGRRST